MCLLYSFKETKILFIQSPVYVLPIEAETITNVDRTLTFRNCGTVLYMPTDLTYTHVLKR